MHDVDKRTTYILFRRAVNFPHDFRASRTIAIRVKRLAQELVFDGKLKMPRFAISQHAFQFLDDFFRQARAHRLNPRSKSSARLPVDAWPPPVISAVKVLSAYCPHASCRLNGCSMLTVSVGVPANVPVPSSLSANVIPSGRVPPTSAIVIVPVPVPSTS